MTAATKPLLFTLCSVLLSCSHGQDLRTTNERGAPLVGKARYIRFHQLTGIASLAAHSQEHALALQAYDSALTLIPWHQGIYASALIEALKVNDEARAQRYHEAGRHYKLYLAHYEDPLIKEFLQKKQAANDPYWTHLYPAEPSPMMDEGPSPTDSGPVYPRTFAQFLTCLEEFYRYYGQMPMPFSCYDMAAYDPAFLTTHIDSLNFEEIIRSCKREGFPTINGDGEDALQDMFRVLLRYVGNDQYPNGAQWQRLKPFINARVEEGSLDPSFMCNLDDKHAYLMGEPLPWGVQLEHLSRKGPVRLVDRAKLNAARTSLGLMTIEDEALVKDWDLQKMVAQ